MAKDKDLIVAVSDETLQALQESYPVEQGSQRIILPRLGMFSQDVTEGKGKQMKVVNEAGTFFTEKPTDEVDADGKKIYDKQEIGTVIEGVILFQRKQLRMYDSATEEFTSSPVYDSNDEIIPIFCNKKEIGRGTPAELQQKYQHTDEKTGKVKSRLEETRVLYIWFNDEVYQMNLRGSSMYSFLTYARNVLPPSVLTEFSSEPKENGSIYWNQMTFTAKRKLSEKEAVDVLNKVRDIKDAVRLEKSQYASTNAEIVESRKKAEADYESLN